MVLESVAEKINVEFIIYKVQRQRILLDKNKLIYKLIKNKYNDE